MEDEARLEKLSKAVFDEAERDAENMINEAIRRKNEAIENGKIMLEAEISEYIRRESEKIRSETINSVTAECIEIRKSLLSVRDGYMKKIFASAEEKLKRFTKSEEYAIYLKNLLDNAKAALGESLTVRVSNADVQLMRKIAPDMTVEASKDIMLGGLVAENATHIADYSFDKKLRGEMERFTTTSAFIIDN
jgi:V/A-type H+-transporting ATPase subunit E